MRPELKMIVHPAVTAQQDQQKANVTEAAVSDSTRATLQHCISTRRSMNTGKKNKNRKRRKERTKRSSTGSSLGIQRLGGGIRLCARPPFLKDAMDASRPADDDAASRKAATQDHVT